MSALIEQVIYNHITVQNAAECTGYNIQYLRRLLRAGKLAGIRVGQAWLIQLSFLETYLQEKEASPDLRCGPKSSGTPGVSSIVNIPCLQMYIARDQEELT